MKTISLTPDQLTWLLNQCVYYEDEPMSSPNNRFIKRIIDKLKKELER